MGIQTQYWAVVAGQIKRRFSSLCQLFPLNVFVVKEQDDSEPLPAHRRWHGFGESEVLGMPVARSTQRPQQSFVFRQNPSECHELEVFPRQLIQKLISSIKTPKNVKTRGLWIALSNAMLWQFWAGFHGYRSIVFQLGPQVWFRHLRNRIDFSFKSYVDVTNDGHPHVGQYLGHSFFDHASQLTLLLFTHAIPFVMNTQLRLDHRSQSADWTPVSDLTSSRPTAVIPSQLASAQKLYGPETFSGLGRGKLGRKSFLKLHQILCANNILVG